VIHEGTVAVVTGGTRGVGKAVADALGESGAVVAAVGRTAPRFAADVGDRESVDAVRALFEAELGRATILVNAAGMFGPIALVQDWAGWGRVVNLTSAASLHPPGALNSADGTAKAALNQFTRHLAAELTGTGVTANVIHPGDLKTDMWADMKSQGDGLGDIADAYRQWITWVEETRGDPLEKAAQLVLDILESDVNGQFLWIDEPLQPAIPSWGGAGEEPLWRR
jgi:NAD(P)-dependent dehydrogenase (short-subunit alcohol dehydrogenase family)